MTKNNRKELIEFLKQEIFIKLEYDRYDGSITVSLNCCDEEGGVIEITSDFIYIDTIQKEF